MDNMTDDPATSRPTPGKEQAGQKPRAMDKEGAVGKQFTGTQAPTPNLMRGGG